MKEYQFFQHRQCEFFPCHENIKLEHFNCLFCFCPLYALKKECGGNFKILENGVKDCSQCLIVHSLKGYDHVMNKIGKLMEQVKEPLIEEANMKPKNAD